MSNVIKGLRNLKGLTQEEMAKIIGINTRTYCLKENNPDTFTVKELKILAATFEVNEEVFFKEKFA